MTTPMRRSGVAKTASDEEIRKAYKKIAKTSHPDLNPGDAKAAERFKAASAAHDLLEGPREAPAVRRRRDRRQRAGAAGAAVLSRVCRGAGGDLPYQPRLRRLRRLFRRLRRPVRRPGARRARARGEGIRMRGADAHYTLSVGFLEAARGRDAADHHAGRQRARREDPAGPRRRADDPAARQGRGRDRRRRGRRRAGDGDGRAARLLRARRRRRPRRAADHLRRGGARRPRSRCRRSTAGWR